MLNNCKIISELLENALPVFYSKFTAFFLKIFLYNAPFDISACGVSAIFWAYM